ncbi:MAG: hypothetical protein CLLPBCKN_005806 [Chroococcidiopsis cubana SAG 39.79]|nr:hypothetical protein [Chroococcidiopsis cubana SAG 39.79]
MSQFSYQLPVISYQGRKGVGYKLMREFRIPNSEFITPMLRQLPSPYLGG